MISTTDPESMTADECRREVASILARGLLRRVHRERQQAFLTRPFSRNGLAPVGIALPVPARESGRRYSSRVTAIPMTIARQTAITATTPATDN